MAGRPISGNTESSKSWFCVLNNPQEIYEGEPNEIAEKCLEEWIKEHPTRTGAVAYCISADNLIHLHMVLEDTNKARFSTLKNTYPKAHLEPTKGTKEQAEDYINKRGKFEEKGEQVIYIARFGEIKGCQGTRRDFEIIEELLEQGKTPREIMAMNFAFRRYDKMIKQDFYERRVRNTPFLRDIEVIWHVGLSGSGKSYESVKIVEEKGEESIYMYTDYESGGLDNYNGEPILFMDEFRGQIKYNILLGLLHGFKGQAHARYSNVSPLWTTVHITSVFPPDMVYKNMVNENRELDTMAQLFRRIKTIVYHYKKDGKYLKIELPMKEYTNYENLKKLAQEDDYIETDEDLQGIFE